MYRAPLCFALSLSLSLVSMPGVAIAQDPDSMSEEDRMDRAKQLYGEGDAAFKKGDSATALAKFEEAYNTYAPKLHVFNINIGLAAYELGDCAKAKVAFQRFLDLVADHPSRSQAQEKLLEIERSKCDQSVPDPVPADTSDTPAATTTPTPISAEYENQDAPELTSRRAEREEAAERERDRNDANRASGKLIGGALLTTVGGLAIVGGVASLFIARSRAQTLRELSSGGPLQYPEGDYSDDEVATLDRQGLKNANLAYLSLLIGGGVLTAVGVTLITLDRSGKKAGDSNAKASRARLTGLAPALLPRGGGAAATFHF